MPHAGTVTVLFGRATGLSARHAQLWSQDSPGVKGSAEPYDEFGARWPPRASPVDSLQHPP